MRRVLFLSLALTLSAQAALAQSLVLPIGRNATNQQSASNPQCNEIDLSGAVISPSNPLPAQLSTGNTAVGTTNPLMVEMVNGTNQLSGLVPKGTVTLPVSQGSSTIPTYMAVTAYQTPVATPTDIVGIVGSATKTVKIHKIILNNTQTTAGLNIFYLVMRSAADTGSTIVNPTLVPLDSANAAATAVVNQYTVANPTTGALIGNIDQPKVVAPAPAGTTSGNFVLFDEKVTGQPIVLRGVAQECDVNFNGAAVPTGLSMSVTVIFSEE